jgi:mono/diheme cytochrome c family protein
MNRRATLAMTCLTAVLFASLIAMGADTANAKGPADRGDAPAGREFALEACTGCHVVSADQPFAPLLNGPPDFRAIANRPNVTAASLRHTIASLPQVPPRGRMANPLLNDNDLANVVVYIMTLREHRANQ